MQLFWSFVRKEFYHIFRDVRSLLMLFGLPVALILIFGYVITSEIRDANIAILDFSKDEITTEITNKLLSSDYFLLSENLSSPDQIEDMFKAGKVREVIIFENHFAENLVKNKRANIQIIVDASDANTANLILSYTRAIIQSYSMELNQAGNQSIKIITNERMLYNEEMKSVFMFVPGTMALILLLVSAMMTSISIAREKELGTMEVILVSPLNPLQIILGKVTPYFVLSFINTLTILVLSYFVFNMPLHGSLLLLLAECMLFILMSLSLGIFISTISPNQQVAMFISFMALMLPTILLSGFIFPIENMPELLQWFSHIMPARWFIVILKNIMLKGTGLLFVWKESLILIGMTVFFILLSVKKFNIRLE